MSWNLNTKFHTELPSVDQIYEEVKEQVKSKAVDLQQQKNKVALTTDMWTLEANEAYHGLSCHYLTQEFELVSVCLAVEHFTGRHTGVNIASGTYKTYTQ